MQIDREQLATVTGGKGAGGGEAPGGGGAGGPGPLALGGAGERQLVAKQDQLAASLRSLTEACEGLRRNVGQTNDASTKAMLGGLQHGE